MNKPLTVEQLKALEVGDWVWIVDLYLGKGLYVEICLRENGIVFESKNYYVLPDFRTYGITWVSYKNKEQAEEGN